MIDFNDILLRQFRIDLIERDKNPHLSFLKLKYNYDYSDICYIVDNLGDKNKTFSDYIYGCSLPRSITELGDSKVLYGDKSDAFEKEVNWALLVIRKYNEKIQFFIDKKEEYEKALIVGDYIKANSYL